MKIRFAPATLPKSGTLVVVVAEGAPLTGMAAAADSACDGRIAAAMKGAGFTGKRDQALDVLAPSGGLDRVILWGAGDAAKLSAHDIELIGGAIAGQLGSLKCKAAAIATAFDVHHPSAIQTAARVASGARLRNYAFERYKTKKSEAVRLADLVLLVKDHVAARQVFGDLDAVAEGVHLARDLVNEPANHLHPVEFARRVKELTAAGLEVEILTPTRMKRLGMGALLGVAQGSAHEPRVALMRWRGARKEEQPIAFIGKGVTFDTGGISIKAAAGMEDMKGDMGGAASVTGLMLVLAKRKAKVNAIGAIGLVENMPDGNAQRPGDVVTSMSGQTIAVLNTDAEGRLVLADVLWYVQDRFKPRFMVDLATLTGAIMVALGKEYAGMFCNNDELAARLFEAGQATAEKVWRMPLAAEYDKLIDSDVADVKNIGGRFGGAITGAQFIQRFVNNVPWAHLDIAGTALDGAKTAINQSWGPGWGVRLLNELVARHYERK